MIITDLTDVIIEVRNKKNGKCKELTLDDIWAYEGEICGIVFDWPGYKVGRNDDVLLFTEEGSGGNRLNPDLEINIKLKQ